MEPATGDTIEPAPAVEPEAALAAEAPTVSTPVLESAAAGVDSVVDSAKA